MAVGIARPTTSIHAGMRSPPTVDMTSSEPSITASASDGSASAKVNAASASTSSGTRSQIVHRITNGNRRASAAV